MLRQLITSLATSILCALTTYACNRSSDGSSVFPLLPPSCTDPYTKHGLFGQSRGDAVNCTYHTPSRGTHTSTLANQPSELRIPYLPYLIYFSPQPLTNDPSYVLRSLAFCFAPASSDSSRTGVATLVMLCQHIIHVKSQHGKLLRRWATMGPPIP